MTPEKKVKEKVVAVLKKYGAYYFYPVTGGYGTSGLFDIVACYKGKFIGIECKAGKGQMTALQERNMEQAKAAGAFALVIREDTVKDLELVLGAL
jgi:Holliday junction resolvase